MKFVGNRALLGAVAMIIVGIVVSMMADQYFTGGHEGEALTTSRWWWEIVLNSQILCAAFIWFTHIDRVKATSGWRLVVSVLQMLSGLVAVLLPLWIAIAAILLGWFEERPTLQVINIAFAICLGSWFISWLIVWGIECYGRRRLVTPWFLKTGHWYLALLGATPILAAIIVSVFGELSGGTQHYIYAPFLFYLQGAMPYFARSFRLASASSEVVDEA